MRQYFNSREKAERNLEIRKKLAYKRIEKVGDVIISDSSFCHCDYRWIYNHKGNYSFRSEELKWYNTLLIVTRDMLEDLKKMSEVNFKIQEDGNSL